MAEILSSDPDVAECAVFGVNDELKGQVPFGLLVLKSGVARDSKTIAAEVVQMVRENIGPVASFKIAIVVQRLPKTRSGKILRGTMQKIANGDLYVTPATIDEPAILAEIEAAIAQAGYAQKPPEAVSFYRSSRFPRNVTRKRGMTEPLLSLQDAR